MTYHVEPGETFVSGQTKEIAAGLLDAAAALGYDPVYAVRTVQGGFVVSEDIAEAFQGKTPAGDDDVYDPADHNADEVLAHLGLTGDGEVLDAEEFDRIVAAEVEGKNRKGIASEVAAYRAKQQEEAEAAAKAEGDGDKSQEG